MAAKMASGTPKTIRIGFHGPENPHLDILHAYYVKLIEIIEICSEIRVAILKMADKKNCPKLPGWQLS